MSHLLLQEDFEYETCLPFSDLRQWLTGQQHLLASHPTIMYVVDMAGMCAACIPELHG